MTRFRRRWAPRLAAAGASAWRRMAGAGAFAAVLAVAPLGLHPDALIPPPTHLAPSAPRGSFNRITLPDLVVITPRGLRAADLAALRRLPGVRAALGVDGAAVRVLGREVNVLGVDPAQFRPWTPLRTASDQGLWTALASGRFLASPGAARTLGLRAGRSYRLGPSASFAFGGAGAFGINGIGLVVSNRATARLGLIPNVATLISAPALSMASLQREVASALRGQGTMISLRREQLPVDSAGSGRPATYLQLFRRSAALYCPGLSWTVLAAIGQIESGDGANNGPSSAGALGPMQFLPSTWRVWGITAFGEPGPPNIMDPYDAVPSAARYLCAAGAARPGGLYRAIYAYNHADWYVRDVLALAQQYARAYG